MSPSPDDGWMDAETQLAEAPADHRRELRLWLRLLTCSTLIESEIRRRLRDAYAFTLPRFDLLAQLDRSADGLVLKDVSRRLMVSAGNVTAIVDRLLQSGHITRTASPIDKRVQIIRMTPEGRADFRRMAERHGDWIGQLVGGLSAGETETLMQLLAKLKASAQAGIAEGGGA